MRGRVRAVLSDTKLAMPKWNDSATSLIDARVLAETVLFSCRTEFPITLKNTLEARETVLPCRDFRVAL